jgi:hypothetical protein
MHYLGLVLCHQGNGRAASLPLLRLLVPSIPALPASKKTRGALELSAAVGMKLELPGYCCGILLSEVSRNLNNAIQTIRIN